MSLQAPWIRRVELDNPWRIYKYHCILDFEETGVVLICGKFLDFLLPGKTIHYAEKHELRLQDRCTTCQELTR